MDNEVTPSKLTKHIVVSADSFVVVLVAPGDGTEAVGVTPSDQSDAPSWENVTWAASGGPIIGPTLTIIMPQDDDEDERIDTS